MNPVPMVQNIQPQDYKPICKASFYKDPQHPNSTNKQIFVHCQNIGLDGRPLDEVIRQSTYTDPETDRIISFDEFADRITRIFVQNNGNVVISENGLARFQNLQDLDIGCNENNLFDLIISQNEFQNTPRLRGLGLRSINLTNESIIAVANLKDRLEYLRLRNVEPGQKFLQLLETFTNLRHVYARNVRRDTNFPTTAFRGSAGQMTWITIESCNLPIITTDMFRGMEKLIKMELFDNMTTAIEPNSFDDLVDLREFSLTYNKISSLPKGLFKNMKNLTHVDLSENGIEVGNVTRSAFLHCEGLVRFDI